MAMIKVNGARLAYDEAGRGPAVVFSHGALGDRRMWDAQMARLAGSYRVIRYDWRGHGESDDAAGEYAQYRDLFGLMDALGVARAALVGCSMGGAYCLDAALAEPDRVSSLSLISPGVNGHQWPEDMLAQARETVHSSVPADRLRAYRERTAPEVREDDVAAMAYAQARMMIVGPGRTVADLDPAVWRAALHMVEDVFRREWRSPLATEKILLPPARGRLREVRVPTLLINGLADVRGIQQLADVIAAEVPGVRRLDLPDTAHTPPMERPAEVNAALAGFLAAAA